MLGFAPETAEAIRALDEHWDGAGQPRGLRGEEIPLLARILCLAQTAEIFHRSGGVRAAWAVLRKRAGRWFDPALVEAFGSFRDDAAFWGTLGDDDIGAWEPAGGILLADDAQLDRIADAFAGVVDAKSPWTYRHSDRTCVIVLSVAEALGADERQLRDLRRAALLHDIGKLAVSNRILDKPAALTASEYAAVREHPLITERILARVPGCEHLATIAGAHHERLDGARLPARHRRRRGDAADARARHRRRLRGADVGPAVPTGAQLGRRAGDDAARGPAPARPRGVRDARGAARRAGARARAAGAARARGGAQVLTSPFGLRTYFLAAPLSKSL